MEKKATPLEVYGEKPFAEKKFIEIKGRKMAYIDEGTGDPIVFQHAVAKPAIRFERDDSHGASSVQVSVKGSDRKSPRSQMVREPATASRVADH